MTEHGHRFMDNATLARLPRDAARAALRMLTEAREAYAAAAGADGNVPLRWEAYLLVDRGPAIARQVDDIAGHGTFERIARGAIEDGMRFGEFARLAPLLPDMCRLMKRAEARVAAAAQKADKGDDDVSQP